MPLSNTRAAYRNSDRVSFPTYTGLISWNDKNSVENRFEFFVDSTRYQLSHIFKSIFFFFSINYWNLSVFFFFLWTQVDKLKSEFLSFRKVDHRFIFIIYFEIIHTSQKKCREIHFSRAFCLGQRQKIQSPWIFDGRSANYLKTSDLRTNTNRIIILSVTEIFNISSLSLIINHIGFSSKTLKHWKYFSCWRTTDTFLVSVKNFDKVI